MNFFTYLHIKSILNVIFVKYIFAINLNFVHDSTKRIKFFIKLNFFFGVLEQIKNTKIPNLFGALFNLSWFHRLRAKGLNIGAENCLQHYCFLFSLFIHLNVRHYLHITVNQGIHYWIFPSFPPLYKPLLRVELLTHLIWFGT